MLSRRSFSTIAARPACVTRSVLRETKVIEIGAEPSLPERERISTKSLLSRTAKASPSILAPPRRQFLPVLLSVRGW